MFGRRAGATVELGGARGRSGRLRRPRVVVAGAATLVVVDPGTVGRNTIHLYLVDARGRPSTQAEAVAFLLTRLGQTEEPSRIQPFPAGPGHWIASTVIVRPGAWRLDVVPELDAHGSSRASLRLDLE